MAAAAVALEKLTIIHAEEVHACSYQLSAHIMCKHRQQQLLLQLHQLWLKVLIRLCVLACLPACCQTQTVTAAALAASTDQQPLTLLYPLPVCLLAGTHAPQQQLLQLR